MTPGQATLHALPHEARPREKLLARGPGALSDAELLALLLRTGLPGKNVLLLAQAIDPLLTFFQRTYFRWLKKNARGVLQRTVIYEYG